jgi:hypothetical protein
VDDDTVKQPEQSSPSRWKGWARSAALVGGGLIAGGILAGTLVANAATDEDTGTSTTQESGDRHGGPRGDEEPLTGDTATAVEEAVLAEYPDATIERLETDSDGVYEAHIITTDDDRITVEFDESYAITGTEEHGGGRGHGHGRDGDRNEDSETGDSASEDADPTA